jgi:CheY-like chemotaxis protein
LLCEQIVQFNPEVLQAGGGSGLGLWITKGIVDLHGGLISVYSAGEGHGCTFKLQIPMRRVSYDHTNQEADAAGPKHKEQSKQYASESVEATTDVDTGAACAASVTGAASVAGGSAGVALDAEEKTGASDKTTHNHSAQEVSQPAARSRPSYRLLVVDDSHLNRKMLVRVMTAQGHVCEEAEDGQQAVDRVKSLTAEDGSFDAILMDFMMPVLDGPSATKQIRALGYQGKIFGVTGNALRSDIDFFISSGANDVLVKPLDMNLFYACMSESTS